MNTRKKEYSVRLELNRFEFPNVPSESCHVDIYIDSKEEVKKGDLCFAPRLNRVMRSNKNLKTPIHKVVAVSCPPELAVKRLPDFLFMRCELPNLVV